MRSASLYQPFESTTTRSSPQNSLSTCRQAPHGAHGFEKSLLPLPATAIALNFVTPSDTALNTAVSCIDKLRDTCSSHKRISVVEVMGHHCGDLAVCAAVACGTEDCLVPEVSWNKQDVYDAIKAGIDAGKRHAILIVCENQTDVYQMAKELESFTGLETRATVLGHIQRGGSPSAIDRVMASRMGAFAVELLKKGESGRCVGVKRGELVHNDIIECITKMKHKFMQDTYDLAKTLR